MKSTYLPELQYIHDRQELLIRYAGDLFGENYTRLLGAAYQTDQGLTVHRLYDRTDTHRPGDYYVVTHPQGYTGLERFASRLRGEPYMAAVAGSQ
jgi:hypothetical protein